jgi:hypothetical protein
MIIVALIKLAMLAAPLVAIAVAFERFTRNYDATADISPITNEPIFIK